MRTGMLRGSPIWKTLPNRSLLEDMRVIGAFWEACIVSSDFFYIMRNVKV